jgi:hypothetical protein
MIHHVLGDGDASATGHEHDREGEAHTDDQRQHPVAE